jgi:hypothetical protein
MLEDRKTALQFQKELVSSVLSTRGGGTIPPNVVIALFSIRGMSSMNMDFPFFTA